MKYYLVLGFDHSRLFVGKEPDSEYYYVIAIDVDNGWGKVNTPSSKASPSINERDMRRLVITEVSQKEAAMILFEAAA